MNDSLSIASSDSPLPYRLDLAGGWLDQPFVSRLHPGAVITLSIAPSHDFDPRGGMGARTRESAVELWDGALPASADYHKLAKILFRYDNPPGKLTISGSQDAIGIVYPGLARAHYAGDYWTDQVDHITDEAIISFLEGAITLIPLGARRDGYDPLADRTVTRDTVRALADASEGAWTAILARDLAAFGAAARESFEAQIAMFPYMVSDAVAGTIARYRDQASGWKVSGAGGGGYLILVTDRAIDGGLKVTVRRAVS
ncbi:MAG: hypothetical protein SGJ24_11715 [Chloroflexota bacterium]|nr:hypothetical protein [Chloroflexota bacterium]